jgi:hypothetical protein
MKPSEDTSSSKSSRRLPAAISIPTTVAAPTIKLLSGLMILTKPKAARAKLLRVKLPLKNEPC